ncbi:hypothetical protein PQX77_008144, partial [Marasmius sp. AFHP31]
MDSHTLASIGTTSVPSGTVNPSLLLRGSVMDGSMGTEGEGLGEFFNLSAMELDSPPVNATATNPNISQPSVSRPRTPPRPPSPNGSNTRRRMLGFVMPAGRWLALPEIGMIHHVHDDGSPCTKPFEHACLAAGFQSGGFLAAYRDLGNHFAGKARSRNDDLTDEILYLRERLRREREEHLEQMKSSGGRSSFDPSKMQYSPTPPPTNNTSSNSKRKSAELEQAEPEPAPPAKRPEITIPTI